MSWNIAVTVRAFFDTGEAAIKALNEAGCQAAVPDRFGPISEPELIDRLADADAVIAGSERYNAATFAACPKLKIVSRWGVGYDAVDVTAATQSGVAVAFTPGLLDESVADYAFALLLSLARRVPQATAQTRAGSWKPLWGADVSGQTLGVIGCGRIGRAVARRAAGFGMRVLGHDVAPPPDATGISFVTLDELLSESDFVSLHAAMAPENRGLIGERELRRMKSTALLVNTARGPLIDEEALARALKEDWIGGAALDVFAKEPLSDTHPFRDIAADKLLLSPHQASFARATGQSVSNAAADAVIRLSRGQAPVHVVNPDVLRSPSLRAKLA